MGVGRRPNPLRIITGTGHRPIPEPVEIAPGVPTMPEVIADATTDEHAREMWNELTELLTAAGILDKTDRYMLQTTCLTYADFMYAREQFNLSPTTLGSQGQTVRSPWFDVMNAARGELRRQLAEFGLTPATRQKLAGLGKKNDDDGDVLGRLLA